MHKYPRVFYLTVSLLCSFLFLMSIGWWSGTAVVAQSNDPPSAISLDNGRGEIITDESEAIREVPETILNSRSPDDVSTGLEGYWPLDDATNPTIDASGQGHDGTLVGNPIFTTTVPAPISSGTALDLDGVDDYVTVGGDEADFDLNILSVSLWMKVDSFTKDYQAILTKGDSAWRIHRSESTNKIEFATNSGGNNQSLVGTVDMLDSNWHHVVAIYDGVKKYLYIDGVLDASTSYTGPVDTNDYPVLIGENGHVSNRYFDGQLDDIRIYSRALSATDVAQLYANQSDQCFVEATGDNITDYSSLDASALQTAVSAASPGDIIKIAGTCVGVQTYNTVTQTVYIAQSLTLQGGYIHTDWLTAPDPVAYPTTLDAQAGGRVVYISTPDNVLLSGFHLVNGSVNGAGGGVYNNGVATIRDTVISSNVALGSNGSGSGIANFGTLTVTNSTFIGNNANWDGGGIYNDINKALVVTNSTFANNSANRYGGGIYSNGPITIQNSTLSSNHANNGGGAYADGDSADFTSILYTTIVSNSANAGGGGLG